MFLFQWDRILSEKIRYNAKEMLPGELNRKLKEASCHIRQTESFIPWSKAAEREIKEMKQGSGRNMIKSRAPKRLWDDCLELESYIRLNTAHGISKLDGKVPETIMPVEMSNISQFF